METYADLKAAFYDTMSRDDLDAGRFVKLAGKDISRRVNSSDIESTMALAFSGGSAPLPAGFQSARAVYSDANDTLTPLTGLQSARLDADAPSYGYRITGGVIEVLPAISEATYYLDYFGSLSDLQSDGDTNEILREHPDVYLYGACMHANIVVRDTQEIAKFAQLYEGGMQAVAGWLHRRRYPTGLVRSPA